MAIKVLIVDDSGFFRRRLNELLSGDPLIEVVGTAQNGREAIEKNKALSPDVITMDYEMPVLDGISALKQIMASKPTAVLMFSSMTHEGAKITLDALEAGAVDYLPKNFEDISRNSSKLKKVLSDRVKAVARSRYRSTARKTEAAAKPAARPVTSAPERPTVQVYNRGVAKHKLLILGTSTGGPVALQTVLTALPSNFPVPILLVQHMPGTFTNAFAERLNRICQIGISEAKDNDSLKPGHALLAPGGKQLMVDARHGGIVRVLEGDVRLNYKPSVDVTFGSAAKAFNNKVLAVVLTGMGADGRDGARMLKTAGSHVWAQNQESCVIYGMPMAVVNAGLADEVIHLNDIPRRLVEAI
ncbi:protein-glutamate methylesterase/protein-glutamine glutaminase [Zooshikella harenae]|uniref:Protein-glutamate methylesterase/protein-glutamine glutaminase n=1 Tax=Zooshikella harenae TaxID=2827238 RepID=A0ABS5ZB12_9GAMM|nr:chemotaxis response regulator protein-glutamate methylesterase [Zooshikella harenae]MBU2710430.1 chemotaxis response regulator protein-glutamate methylesterase [Zooshikella harenae]